MTCLTCKDLTRVLESANSSYRAALSAPFYLVSTELAAKMQVDMERAKTILSEHQSSCESVERALALQVGAPWKRGLVSTIRKKEE